MKDTTRAHDGSRRRAVHAFALTTALTVRAAAQTPPAASPVEVAQSRELFRAGLDAMDAAQWETARIAFGRAYALVPSPLTLLDLAGAEAHTAHLLSSGEHYRRFLREAVSPPAAQYRTVAETALRDVDLRTPHVRFLVHGVGPHDAVTLDEQPVAAMVLETSVPLDPGAHRLRVEREGTVVGTVSFDLPERATRDISLTLAAVQPVVSIVRTAHPRVVHHRTTPFFASPWTWVGAAALVVAAGVTVGVVLATRPGPYAGETTPPTLVVRE